MSGRNSGTAKARGETIRVLLDGWPMNHERNSPSYIHAYELLYAGKQAGVEMHVALPGYPYDGYPPKAIIRPVSHGAWGRLLWEQKVLPDLVRKTGAHLLHSLTGSLPVICPVPCVYSPAGARNTSGSGLMDDIQVSFGRGGYSRARALLWPDDLPEPQCDIPLIKLPAHAHPAFSTEGVRLYYDLPDDYIFCPGPLNESELEKLAAAWGWISAGLGEDWTLVVDGIYSHTAAEIRKRSGSPVRVVNIKSAEVGTRATLMQKAAAVLLVGRPTSWGDPMLQALACGRPIAAEESDWNALRAGDAAYLTAPGDTRLLGAAALTPAVEESMAERLSAAALARAQTLRSESFPDRLRQAYQDVLN